MTKSSFLFIQDENSEWYATVGHDEASKTRRGVIDDTATNYEKLGRMYQRGKMKELSKAASLYQSLPQGNSNNTVVGCWFVNDAVRPQE